MVRLRDGNLARRRAHERDELVRFSRMLGASINDIGLSTRWRSSGCTGACWDTGNSEVAFIRYECGTSQDIRCLPGSLEDHCGCAIFEISGHVEVAVVEVNFGGVGFKLVHRCRWAGNASFRQL